jgi:hypothetical protein
MRAPAAKKHLPADRFRLAAGIDFYHAARGVSRVRAL